MFKRIMISILVLFLFVGIGIAQNTTAVDRLKLRKTDATFGDLIFANGEFITNDTDGTLSFGTALLTFTGVVTIGTGIVADAQDGAYIGTSLLQFSDIFLADGAVIAFGDDGEVTLTHVADTGLLLTDASGVGTTQLQFGDNGTYIYQVTDGVLGLIADTEVDITVTTLDINANVNISGISTLTGEITSTGGINFATETPVIWTTGGSGATAFEADSTGTDTSPTNGPRWWSEIMIPYNVTLTGGFYLVGSTGGTDSVMVELFNSAGVLVADNVDDHVNEPAVEVGTANQFQKVAFESTYNAVAGKYYLCVSFNGTTARFRTYAITGSPFIAATAGGTWKTSASITPGTTFTADKGPIGGVY